MLFAPVPDELYEVHGSIVAYLERSSLSGILLLYEHVGELF